MDYGHEVVSLAEALVDCHESVDKLGMLLIGMCPDKETKRSQAAEARELHEKVAAMLEDGHNNLVVYLAILSLVDMCVAGLAKVVGDGITALDINIGVN